MQVFLLFSGLVQASPAEGLDEGYVCITPGRVLVYLLEVLSTHIEGIKADRTIVIDGRGSRTIIPHHGFTATAV